MSGGTFHIQYTQHNQIELVKGGSAYFSLLHQLINEAITVIYIQVYILQHDSTGKQLVQSLIQAADRKVQVYILADGYASQELPKSFINEMKQAGIRFRFFEPLLRSSRFYFGRRMHQKVVAIDGIHALVGGINMADRYNDVDAIPAWLDYALYVKGSAAREVLQICAGYWPPAQFQLPTIQPVHPGCSVRVRYNDWVKKRQQVWKTYFNMFHQAQSSITIMCSYFLPGRTLRKQLAKAAARGVKIKVILAGPSDVVLAKYAERYLYQWMLKQGIEVYEYQPTVLHAKMAVSDEHWVTVGSFNVNNISAYASIEMNLEVRNRPFARHVQNILNDVIKNDCIPVTYQTFASNATIFKRFLQRSAYELVRGIINLSTFYFKTEN